MFSNFLKICFRNFMHYRTLSVINVLGLSLGIACCILIMLFVKHELSYDKYHLNTNDIYRLSFTFNSGVELADNSPSIAPLLKENFSEVEQVSRVSTETLLVRKGEIAFLEENFLLADSNIFEMFSFEWLSGNPQEALAAPYTVVITESFAKKYFGNEDALGQTVFIENVLPMTVTGVIGDFPDNTHLKGDAIASVSSAAAFDPDYLTGGGFRFHTYVQFKPGIDITSIESQLPVFLEQHRPDLNARGHMEMMSIADIHFKSNKAREFKTPGNQVTVYSFTLIALGILLIACINFMNLSTANSSTRAKEIGMRKAIGAYRGQIIRQFLTESIWLSIIAMGAALVLVEIFMPVFARVVAKDIDFSLFENALLLPTLLGLSLLIGVIAGSYPAFFLSAFEPSRVLKGELSRGKAGVLFRNVLVVGQFSISISLIIATTVIFLQTQFAKNIELGFETDQVVILTGSPLRGLGTQWETMKQELELHPDIMSVTASRDAPGSQIDYTYNFLFEGGDVEASSMLIKVVEVDFFETYGISILAGRSFNSESSHDNRMPTDSNQVSSISYIVNKQAALEMGWDEEQSIGKWMEFEFGLRGPIVGVVDDVHYESIRDERDSLVYILGHAQLTEFYNGDDFVFHNGAIKITGNNIPDTLSHIDATWKKFMPGQPVLRRFLDEDFEAMYLSEKNEGRLIGYFSCLAVAIACMGLFGLAAFNAERRRKEIGVRKVMGSTVWSIVLLLTNDFSKLVLIANVLAWPIAYFTMSLWLENFAYRIDLTFLVFIGSGLIALCIAWVTVGGTAAKAASQKPVLALRYE